MRLRKMYKVGPSVQVFTWEGMDDLRPFLEWLPKGCGVRKVRCGLELFGPGDRDLCTLAERTIHIWLEDGCLNGCADSSLAGNFQCG